MSANAHPLPSLWQKALYWTDKMMWGYRAVGIGAALKGSARMAYLYARRPQQSELHLRSGQILEFKFPSQIPRALLMFGDFVDPEFAFLRRTVRPDWIVADVGAAIGQFTLFAATLPVASVAAFEPGGANVAALSANTQRNGVADRVDIYKTALSNCETEARFDTTDRAWVGGLSETGSEIVPVRTLSAEFPRLGLDHVSVLKINVAGFEPSVIEGAMDYLAQGRADILILLLGLESLPWYARVAKIGYRFFYYHPKEAVLYELTAFNADSVLNYRPWPARNIIAIHPSAIDDVLARGISLRRLALSSAAPPA